MVKRSKLINDNTRLKDNQVLISFVQNYSLGYFIDVAVGSVARQTNQFVLQAVVINLREDLGGTLYQFSAFEKQVLKTYYCRGFIFHEQSYRFLLLLS